MLAPQHTMLVLVTGGASALAQAVAARVRAA
eukprot:COSAG06_NODE_54395_length_294_cov_2.579487_1_plen_30_part_10